nr:hypothetical protein [Sphaerotilus hippei]
MVTVSSVPGVPPPGTPGPTSSEMTVVTEAVVGSTATASNPPPVIVPSVTVNDSPLSARASSIVAMSKVVEAEPAGTVTETTFV